MVMKLQDKVCNKKLCTSTEVCIPKGNFNWSQFETYCSDIDYIPYQVMINLYHGFNLTEYLVKVWKSHCFPPNY